jgi:hypothetical protein
MRNRQRQAVRKYLMANKVEVYATKAGQTVVEYPAGSNDRTIALRGNFEDTPDDLLCEITRSDWEHEENEDRKDTPAYDRT